VVPHLSQCVQTRERVFGGCHVRLPRACALHAGYSNATPPPVPPTLRNPASHPVPAQFPGEVLSACIRRGTTTPRRKRQAVQLPDGGVAAAAASSSDGGGGGGVVGSGTPGAEDANAATLMSDGGGGSSAPAAAALEANAAAAVLAAGMGAPLHDAAPAGFFVKGEPTAGAEAALRSAALTQVWARLRPCVCRHNPTPPPPPPPPPAFVMLCARVNGSPVAGLHEHALRARAAYTGTALNALTLMASNDDCWQSDQTSCVVFTTDSTAIYLQVCAPPPCERTHTHTSIHAHTHSHAHAHAHASTHAHARAHAHAHKLTCTSTCTRKCAHTC
jgi:hypothetical protein